MNNNVCQICGGVDTCGTACKSQSYSQTIQQAHPIGVLDPVEDLRHQVALLQQRVAYLEQRVSHLTVKPSSWSRSLS